MKKVIGLALAVAFLTVPFAMAEELGAGCGLGKTVFEGKKGILFQNLAWTTNATLFNQVFGITSGTSGCDADQVILRDEEQKVFVAVNFDNLSTEMAQGRGEYLNSLASLMGCNTGVYGDFAQMTQEKYAELFSGDGSDPSGLLTGLKREMAADASLSAGCNRIS